MKKRLICLALVLCLAASLGCVAFADNNPLFSLTTNGGKEISTLKMPQYLLGTFDPLIADYPEEAAEIVEEAKEYYPLVYFTSDISAEALVNIYRALGWEADGKTAVKISTGENGSNYLRPELIADLVHEVDGTIVECNTAYDYTGDRDTSAAHWKLIEEHGFLNIAPCDIMDEEGTLSLPARDNFTRLDENIVGSHFANYDSFIVLSHFKGHAMAGFGGAIKNASIGIAAAPEGKKYIHTGGNSKTEWMDELVDEFQEAMAEATMTVSDALGEGKNVVYINVLNRVSIDCDCDPNPSEPDIHDIGIMASTDPVALDQASVDIASLMDGSGRLMYRIADRHGFVSLEHAEEIGLGSRTYLLECIDS